MHANLEIQLSRLSWAFTTEDFSCVSIKIDRQDPGDRAFCTVGCRRKPRDPPLDMIVIFRFVLLQTLYHIYQDLSGEILLSKNRVYAYT